jgi:N6-L-threonylcarbamoyladenine synthase
VLILGIETSCDETSASIVDSGTLLLSNVISSQIALHAPFGGVVPEIASRQHVLAITHVTRQALLEAGVSKADLHAVAATYGPGLAGALLVGLNFARGLSFGLGLPFIPVNHLEGHLHSVWVHRADAPGTDPELPMLALVVSGGHTQLVLMKGHGKYELVGRTRDDAAGEAFDKVARLIGLPYPGGPAIQAAAEHARAPIDLPRAWLPGTFDFSFSGLKTAALHAVYEMVSGRSAHQLRGTALPRVDVASGLTPEQRSNVAAGFQQSVVDVLVTKTLQAAREYAVRSVAIVGGVAANTPLRLRMKEVLPLPVHVSTPDLATDNAAMIAAAAYFVRREDSGIDVQPNLRLSVES